MAYIYKIINDINQKIYIGKTKFSIEKRFKEHCSDAYRRSFEKRPLYAAMRKYGIEHYLQCAQLYLALIPIGESPIARFDICLCSRIGKDTSLQNWDLMVQVRP